MYLSFVNNYLKRYTKSVNIDLEYPWYVKDAVKLANPNGEAEKYLKFLG